MNIEEAIELLQILVFAKTSKYLDNLQIKLIQGSWENQTYEQIAETYCFSTAHAKTVGAKLWDFLSQLMGTKVNKKNLRTLVERQVRKLAADLVTDVTDELSISPNSLPSADHLSIRSPTQSFPSAIPEIPGGQVSLDSPFYIERFPIEAQCYATISEPGALIRIYAPRQMGKTSLMSRILDQAREQGYHTVTLSFQLASSTIFTNLDRFLQWFCASVSKSLGLPNQLADYWDDMLGGNSSTTDYFENYLLAQIDCALVIGLDDVDVVLRYAEIASNFFCLLRTWYEKAKYGDNSSQVWKKLRLIVVHCTEVFLPLNISRSPFNVGLSIDLPEFTKEQVLDLVERYGFDWSDRQVEQLRSLVGGYPYLVQKTLFHIWYGNVTLEQLFTQSATKYSVYREHLYWQFLTLQQYPELLRAFAEVASSPLPVELERVQALQLEGIGLVHLKNNLVMPSCDLYRQYFDQKSQDKALKGTS